jgi:hypothetical protein
MQRKSYPQKSATPAVRTAPSKDALLPAHDARRRPGEYRHEQREELSAVTRETSEPGDKRIADITAYAQAFAIVVDSISGLVKSLTPARAGAYVAALITLLQAMHLLK